MLLESFRQVEASAQRCGSGRGVAFEVMSKTRDLEHVGTVALVWHFEPQQALQWAMAGARTTRKAHLKRVLRAKMPFNEQKDRKKPTTWRQKQSVYVQAGLRALKAPLVFRLHLNRRSLLL